MGKIKEQNKSYLITVYRLKKILKRIELKLNKDKYNHFLMVRYEKVKRLILNVTLENQKQIVL